jgi:hypothetical protein
MPAWFCACGVPKGEEAAIFRRLTNSGWTRVNLREAARLAALRISIRHVSAPASNISDLVFAPTWAVEIGPDNTARLREAKKSTNIRKAVLAERALRESREP